MSGRCRQSPKRCGAATFTQDARHLLFADKFGDVYSALAEEASLPAPTGALQCCMPQCG